MEETPIMNRRPQDRPVTGRRRTTIRTAAGRALLLAWGAAVGWLAGPAGVPALAAPPPPGFAESTQVTAIEIPVQVSKDGQPVRGLTAADFEVFDGRNRQTITGFDVVDLSLPASQALSAPIPVEARRHFLLLFDLAFSEAKSIVKARDAARDVMLKQLVPSDLVAVATYASSSGPRLVLGFTSDRRQIAAAIDHLGLPELVDRSPDPLQLVADDVKSGLFESSRAPASAPNGVKATMQQLMVQSLQESARASERANRESQMSIVSAMTRSLADLGRLMASVSGRKQVVYFSEGFNSSFLEGAESKQEQDAMSQESQFGNIQNVDSDARFGSTHQNNQLEAMLESFRRSDCVIQAVDIGGLRAEGDLGPTRASGEATLFQMAKDTGGELFRSFNDLGAAMDRLLKQTSLTYVLTIQPAELKPDGQYHKLRVQLKNGSRSVQVSARSGFYAPVAYSRESPLAKKLAAADALMSARRAGTVDLAVLAAPFRTSLDKAYVPVVIEAGGPSLLAGGDGASLPAEIYAYAIDAQGQIQDYFDQALRLDVAKAPPALRQAGLKFFGHLELGAGEYWLRVVVRNGATGAFGMRAERLVVPAFGELNAVVLPPFFPEVPGRWMIVREPPRGAQKSAAYPFMIEDHPYIPASRPELVSGQELPLALMGYNWGTGGLTPAARVESADGRDLGPAALQVAGRAPGNGAKPDEIKASLRLPAGLAPGEYRLVVTMTPAAAASGGAVQAASASFAVVAAAKGAGGGT
jgi:VWFA-related protein